MAGLVQIGVDFYPNAMSLPLCLVMLSSKHSLVGRQRVKTGHCAELRRLAGAPRWTARMTWLTGAGCWSERHRLTRPRGLRTHPSQHRMPVAIPLAPPTAGCSNAELPSCWTMVTLFCATATSLRHACFTSARPVPVTGGQHCGWERPSIRNSSAALALTSCRPIRQRPGFGIAVLATSARSTPNLSRTASRQDRESSFQ
jgi:hypothetical protein